MHGRPRILRPLGPLATALLASLLLPGCQRPAAPAPPAAIAAAPAAFPPPPRVTGTGYATFRTERGFRAPLAPLRRHLADGDRFAAAVVGSDRVPRRVGTDAVRGVWPEADAVRIVRFSDGHRAWERVLASDPTLLRWQTWGHTGPTADHVAYAVGEQAWTDLGPAGSHLVWTHRLKPGHPWKRFFVQRFVGAELGPQLEAAIDAARGEAEAAFAEAAATADPATP